MLRRYGALLALLVCILHVPFLVHAGFADFLPKEIVPCGNTTRTEIDSSTGVICNVDVCTPCHLVQLGQNIINFLVFAAIVVFVFLLVNAGFLLVTSGSNSGQVSRAKNMVKSGVIGFIIMLAAWLLIDTIMKAVYNGTFGPWNEILCPTDLVGKQCVVPRKPLDLAPPAYIPHALGVGYSPTEYNITSEGYILKSNGISVSTSGLSKNCTLPTGQTCYEYIQLEAIRLGVDPVTALAIAAIESRGKASAVSPVGAIGVMQIMPTTARSLCGQPCSGMSQADLEAYLKNPANNITLGVMYLKDALNNPIVQSLSKGDPVLERRYVATYYNAGIDGGLGPSKDCPGMVKIDCDKNLGGLSETRGYISNLESTHASIIAQTN